MADLSFPEAIVTMEIQPTIDRIVLLGIFALLFGVWGIYWYYNAANLDRLMTQDWLAQVMRIEDKIPKEKRIAAFRKRAMTIIALAIFLFLWLLIDLYRLIKVLWK
mgnify:CR=1 FL=1